MKPSQVRRVAAPALAIAVVISAGALPAHAATAPDPEQPVGDIIDPNGAEWVGTGDSQSSVRMYDAEERRARNDAFRAEQESLIAQEEAGPDTIQEFGGEPIDPDGIVWVGTIEEDGSIRMYSPSERAERNESFQEEQEELLAEEAEANAGAITPFITSHSSCTSTMFKAVAKFPYEGPAWRGFCYSGYGTMSVTAMHSEVLGVCPGPYTGRIYVQQVNGTQKWHGWFGPYTNNLSPCFDVKVATRSYSKVAIWQPGAPAPVSIDPVAQFNPLAAIPR